MGGSASSVGGGSRVTIACVGVTGAGKSTTCNTLAGQCNIFPTSDGFESVTREAISHDCLREGITLRIIDTVGFISNTGADDVDWQWSLQHQALSPTSPNSDDRFKDLATASDGVDAFLFLEKFDRFTEDSRRHFETFKTLVGAEGLSHTVLVFTHITNARLQDALSGDLPPQLSDVIYQVKEVVGVENIRNPGLAASDLMEAIRKLRSANENRRYTSSALEMVREHRSKTLARIKALRSPTMRKSFLWLHRSLVHGPIRKEHVVYLTELSENENGNGAVRRRRRRLAGCSCCCFGPAARRAASSSKHTFQGS